jgi:hypothetical protein
MLTKVSDNCEGDFVPDIIHLGCGSYFMRGAMNIDTSINRKGFMVCPKKSMVYQGEITSPQDLPKKHFKRVEAHMVFEHIHPDLIPNLLYCLCNFLQDNGAIVATVPNFMHLSNRLVQLYYKKNWRHKHFEEMREINNEFLCPNMCGMTGHQSIWTIDTATMWLNAEGFELVSWTPSDNKMHIHFEAIKRGGDHVSRI